MEYGVIEVSNTVEKRTTIKWHEEREEAIIETENVMTMGKIQKEN